MKKLDDYCESGTLILITVHSVDHLSSQKQITEDSYFKSFYSKSDLIKMFPDSAFEHISYTEKEKIPDNDNIALLKHWIEEFYKQTYTALQIKKIQEKYIKESRINSIDFLVRKL